MPPEKKSTPSENKSISINGDVRDSNVFIGDNNVFQKIINYIFPSEKETLEQRDRRLLLGHVENAWIKGVLDASLHGAALLDLGIKQDPEAVTKYPWAIKKESTNETLSTGTSMLEIFDSIGMGRSLLILGAPGSGKTTMLLELARQLIARAREDVTQPIPMVFNLASWTEKLTLTDWLAQELNNLYSVPRKTAPDWVKGNKLLLLLDGLDEVRQESRAKCVEAINEFRKQNGFTSLAVCSRSQDYADLNAKLSFEGAIEVQPLTQKQIAEFFNRFGDEITGIKQALEKDNGLREMAETPLFLSIMLMAYRGEHDVEILISGDERVRRKHLFDTYIEHMLKRRIENALFKKEDILRWISWISHHMFENHQNTYFVQGMKPSWIEVEYQRIWYFLVTMMASGLIGVGLGWLAEGVIDGVIFGVMFAISSGITFSVAHIRFDFGLLSGLISGIIYKLICMLFGTNIFAIIAGITLGVFFAPLFVLIGDMYFKQMRIIIRYTWLDFALEIIRMIRQGRFLLAYSFYTSLIFGLIFWATRDLVGNTKLGFLFGLLYGWSDLIAYKILLIGIKFANLLPWKLVPFLDHCVDLIFLRRVGGGYIFVHRLLMEHFAEMYVEPPASKGN